MIDTDKLIEQWKRGDEYAARLLYEQYYLQIFRLACGLLDSMEDAEEVMQDTLTYALTKIDRYDRQRAQFTTWLHTITVSRARDKHRRNRWWQPANLLGLDRLTKMADQSSSPVQRVEQAKQREDILQAVQMLKPIQREVLMLRYWGEHTMEEIAQIVDCPVGTVKSRLRLAHKKLEPLLTASLSDSVSSDNVAGCLSGTVSDNIFEGV